MPDDFTPTQVLAEIEDQVLVDSIAATMRRQKGWGDIDPILVRIDPADGEKFILDGHHRVEAARKAGVEVKWREATPEEIHRFGSGRR